MQKWWWGSGLIIPTIAKRFFQVGGKVTRKILSRETIPFVCCDENGGVGGAGVVTVSIFPVGRSWACGGWKGVGGLRGSGGCRAGFSPSPGVPQTWGSHTSRGSCPDGAERGAVWNLAVQAQSPPPAAFPPLRHQLSRGWTPHPGLPTSHCLEATSSRPASALPHLCQPLKCFPWSFFCPQDWSESLTTSSPPNLFLRVTDSNLGEGGRGRETRSWVSWFCWDLQSLDFVLRAI